MISGDDLKRSGYFFTRAPPAPTAVNARATPLPRPSSLPPPSTTARNSRGSFVATVETAPWISDRSTVNTLNTSGDAHRSARTSYFSPPTTAATITTTTSNTSNITSGRTEAHWSARSLAGLSQDEPLRSPRPPGIVPPYSHGSPAFRLSAPAGAAHHAFHPSSGSQSVSAGRTHPSQRNFDDMSHDALVNYTIRLDDDMINARDNLQQAYALKDDYKNQVARLLQDLEDSEQLRKRLERDVSRYEEITRGQQQDISFLRAKLDAAEGTIRTQHATLDDSSSISVQYYIEQLQKKEQELQLCCESKKEMQLRIDHLDSELRRTDVTKAENASLERKLNELTDANEKLQGEINEYRKQISEKSATIAGMSASESEYAALLAENNTLRADLDKYDSLARSQEDHIRNLSTSLMRRSTLSKDDEEHVRQQSNDLHKEVTYLKAQLLAQAKERDMARSQVLLCQAQLECLFQAHKTAAEEQAHVKRVRESIRKQHENDLISQCQLYIEALESRNKELATVNEQLQQHLHDLLATTALSAQAQTLADSTVGNEASQPENVSTDIRTATAIEHQLLVSQQQIEVLHEQRSELISHYQDIISNMKNECHCERLKQDLHDATDKLQAAEQRAQQLESQSVEQNALIEKLSRELQHLREDGTSDRTDSNSVNTTHKKYIANTTSRTPHSSVSETEDETDYESLVAVLTHELRCSEARFATLQTTTLAAKADAAAAIHQTEQMQVEVDTMKKSLITAQASEEDARVQLHHMHEQVNTLQQSLIEANTHHQSSPQTRRTVKTQTEFLAAKSRDPTDEPHPGYEEEEASEKDQVIFELNVELRRLLGERESSEAAFHALKLSEERAIAEAKELQGRVTVLEQAASKEASKVTHEHEIDAASAKKHTSNLLQQLADAQGAITKLSSENVEQNARIEELSSSLKNAQSQLIAINSSSDASGKEVKRLQAERESSEATFHALKLNEERAIAEAKELQGRVTVLEQAASKEASKTVHEQELEAASAKKHTSSLLQQLADAQGAIVKLSSENVEQNARIEELSSSLKNAQNQLIAINSSSDDSEKDQVIHELDFELRRLLGERESSEAAFHALKLSEERAIAEAKELRGRVTVLEQAASKEASKAVHEQELDAATSKKHTSNLLQQLADANGAIAKLSSVNVEQNARIEELSSSLKNAQSQLIAINSSSDASGKEVKRLQAERESSEAAFHALKLSEERAIAEAKELRGRVTVLEQAASKEASKAVHEQELDAATSKQRSSKLAQELADALGAIAKLSSENVEQNARIEELSSSNDDSGKEVKRLQAERESSEAAFHALKLSEERAIAEAKELRGRVTVLEQAASKEASKLTQQLADAQGAITKLSSENVEQNARIEELSSSLHIAQNQLTVINRSNDDSEKDQVIFELNVELRRLLGERESSEAAFHALKLSEERAIAEAKELQGRVTVLEQAASKEASKTVHEQELEAASAKKHTSSLLQQLADAQGAIVKLSSENVEQNARIEELSSSLKNAQNQLTAINSSSDDSEKDQVIHELDFELRRHLGERESSEAAFHALKLSEERAIAEAKELRGRVTVLEQAASKEASKTVHEHELDAATSKKHTSNLLQQLADANGAIAKLSSVNVEQNARIEELSSSLQNSQNQLTVINSSSDASGKEVKRLQAERESSEATFHALKLSEERAIAEVKELQGRVTFLKQAASKEASKVTHEQELEAASAKKHTSNLLQQLADAQGAIAKLSSVNVEQNARIEELSSSLRIAQEQLTAINRSNDDSGKEVKRLQAERESSEAAFHALKLSEERAIAEAKELQGRVTVLEQAASKTTHEHELEAASAKKYTSNLLQQLADAKGAITKLSSESVEQNARIEELGSSLRIAQEQLKIEMNTGIQCSTESSEITSAFAEEVRILQGRVASLQIALSASKANEHLLIAENERLVRKMETLENLVREQSTLMICEVERNLAAADQQLKEYVGNLSDATASLEGAVMVDGTKDTRIAEMIVEIGAALKQVKTESQGAASSAVASKKALAEAREKVARSDDVVGASKCAFGLAVATLAGKDSTLAAARGSLTVASAAIAKSRSLMKELDVSLAMRAEEVNVLTTRNGALNEELGRWSTEFELFKSKAHDAFNEAMSVLGVGGLQNLHIDGFEAAAAVLRQFVQSANEKMLVMALKIEDMLVSEASKNAEVDSLLNCRELLSTGVADLLDVDPKEVRLLSEELQALRTAIVGLKTQGLQVTLDDENVNRVILLEQALDERSVQWLTARRALDTLAGEQIELQNTLVLKDDRIADLERKVVRVREEGVAEIACQVQGVALLIHKALRGNTAEPLSEAKLIGLASSSWGSTLLKSSREDPEEFNRFDARVSSEVENLLGEIERGVLLQVSMEAEIRALRQELESKDNVLSTAFETIEVLSVERDTTQQVATEEREQYLSSFSTVVSEFSRMKEHVEGGKYLQKLSSAEAENLSAAQKALERANEARRRAEGHLEESEKVVEQLRGEMKTLKSEKRELEVELRRTSAEERLSTQVRDTLELFKEPLRKSFASTTSGEGNDASGKTVASDEAFLVSLGRRSSMRGTTTADAIVASAAAVWQQQQRAMSVLEQSHVLQMSTLQAEVVVMQRESQELRKRLRKSINLLRNKDIMLREAQVLASETERTRHINVALQQEITTTRQTYESQIQVLRISDESLKEELRVIRATCDRVSSSLADAEDALARMTKEKRDQEIEAQANKTELELNMKRMAGTLETLRMEMQHKNIGQSAPSSDSSRKSATLPPGSAGRPSVSPQEVNVMRARVEDLEARIVSRDKEIDRLQSLLVFKEKEIAQLEEQLGKVSRAFKVGEEKRIAAEDQVRWLQERLNSVETELNKFTRVHSEPNVSTVTATTDSPSGRPLARRQSSLAKFTSRMRETTSTDASMSADNLPTPQPTSMSQAQTPSPALMSALLSPAPRQPARQASSEDTERSASRSESNESDDDTSETSKTPSVHANRSSQRAQRPSSARAGAKRSRSDMKSTTSSSSTAPKKGRK